MENNSTSSKYFEGMNLLLCEESDELIHNYLMSLVDSGTFQSFNSEIKWEELIFPLIEKSNFNVRRLLDYRQNNIPENVLFNIFVNDSRKNYSYHETIVNVKTIAYYLLDKRNNSAEPQNFKVAILSENCLEMVLVDLGSLYGGVVDVIIPPIITEEHLAFILNQSKPKIIFVQSVALYEKIRYSPYIKQNEVNLISLIDKLPDNDSSLLSQLLSHNDSTNVDSLITPLKINDLATIMYTSGTTGEPKGIMFSNMNIMSKRFARAIALPVIGKEDIFLSYLPLFHTFGRYLEMIGTIFWGAKYVFVENTSIDTLVKLMISFKPTIFISIPKKWTQLYEYIADRVDVETFCIDEIKLKVEEITGGKLKWGLSAAGFLSPDIFNFFQRNGLNLLSGFGMTEATGGITMTPPGQYKDNSIGLPLPGIETNLGAESELLIRGNYVMLGYYGIIDQPFLQDMWFPTGDIMKIDEDNYHYIVDRKKDIYKNSRGETIAPQKIENLFLESEYVKQVFLVGDHRPYNTLLIYPNKETQFLSQSETQRSDLFASLIVSVNKFLPKHERIIDYRLIECPFSLEKEEITPKSTLKRWVIERNFAALIQEMYIKNYKTLIFNDFEINIPNWFLKEKGLLQQDLINDCNGIKIPKLNKSLIVVQHRDYSDILRIGDFYYKVGFNKINLEDLITNPLLWLGNKNLFDFCENSIADWIRVDRVKGNTQFYGIIANYDFSNYEKCKLILTDEINSPLIKLHFALCFIYSKEELINLLGINYLSIFIETNNLLYFKLSKEIIARINVISSQSVLRELFALILKHTKEREFKYLLEIYLNKLFNLFDKNTTNLFIEYATENELAVIEDTLDDLINTFPVDGNIKKSSIPYLLNLLCEYGINHPTKYVHIRQVFSKYETPLKQSEFSLIASQNRKLMRVGFRNWLGPVHKLAVDPDTGQEYILSDVIIFDDSCSKEDRIKIISALKESNIIRESVFLFSKGILIALNNIVPAGVFISLFRTEINRRIFKVNIQTRFQGSHSILLTLYNGNIREVVLEEVNWMILAGSRYFLSELVEDFGAIWDEHNLWTSKYIPSDTVRRQLNRYFKKLNYESITDKEILLWYFYIWNCSATYFNFIRLTNLKYKISSPDIDSFYVPEHDYHLGTRLVSFSARERYVSLKDAIDNFENYFINNSLINFPVLPSDEYSNFIFSGLLNAFGEKVGITMLKEYLISEQQITDRNEKRISLLLSFIDEVERIGFMPKQVFFAINRFLRWYRNNLGASNIALAHTINDIYETYHLNYFETDFPEVRVKYYLNTVFNDSNDKLKGYILKLINQIHHKQKKIDDISDYLLQIKLDTELSEKEEYFLTRLTYPFVKPDSSAVLVKSSSEAGIETNLVVQYEDCEGNSLFIRKPVNPKEINKLFQLFLDANLQVTFKSNHQYLVVTSEQGHIVGGLFYFAEDTETVRMEKIVINRKFRGKGVSDLLMKDLFSRLKSKNYNNLTTGYFRPEYFYKFGFKLDNKFGGLVKEL